MSPSDTDEFHSLHDELEALRERVASLEDERNQLTGLQRIFTLINSSLDVEQILATVLTGIHEALRFRRVVLLDAAGDMLSRRLEIAGESGVFSPLQSMAGVSTTTRALLSGTKKFALGLAGDENCPLDDASGIYAMQPLVSRGNTRGILYVEGPPNDDITPAHLRKLDAFASQATVALENARLYEEAQHLLAETQRLALTDALTGLPNRRAINEQLEREIRNAVRYQNQLAFVMFDLDDFKHINDTLGHSAGDAALKLFARTLRTAARNTDLVARLAGDEFVVGMTQVNRTTAELAITRIFAALADNGISCSAGIALFDDDGADASTLYAAADKALYTAKEMGKHRWIFHDPQFAAAN